MLNIETQGGRYRDGWAPQRGELDSPLQRSTIAERTGLKTGHYSLRRPRRLVAA